LRFDTLHRYGERADECRLLGTRAAVKVDIDRRAWFEPRRC